MTYRTHGLTELVVKTAITHTATYFLFGVTAAFVLSYSDAFFGGQLASIARPTTDPMVMVGPLIQPIRGALFGIVFFLLRDSLFARPTGWLVMWAMLAIIGVLGTFGAAPGSIESAFYTTLSWPAMIDLSMIELYGQSLALAAGVFFWVRYPKNRWLGGFLSVVTVLVFITTIAGFILVPPAA